MDEWADAGEGRTAAVDALKLEVRSNDLMEFEVRDAGGFGCGTVLAEVIGTGMEPGLGVSVNYIYPLAAEQRRSTGWLLQKSAPHRKQACGLHPGRASARGERGIEKQRGSGESLCVRGKVFARARERRG